MKKRGARQYGGKNGDIEVGWSKTGIISLQGGRKINWECGFLGKQERQKEKDRKMKKRERESGR